MEQLRKEVFYLGQCWLNNLREHCVEGESRGVVAHSTVCVLLVHSQISPAHKEADDALEEGLEHGKKTKDE